jgi:hypothetical protein
VKISHLLITIAVIIILLISAGAIIVLNSSSTDRPVLSGNYRDGNLAVFHQDYSTMSAVPSNVFLGNVIAPYAVVNQTLSYDKSAKALDLHMTGGRLGTMFISGLSPSILTNTSFDVSLGRANQDHGVNIIASNCWLEIQVRDGIPSDGIQINSYYYDSTGSLISKKVFLTDLGYKDYARFTVTIATDNHLGTNAVSFNGVQQLVTPLYSKGGSPNVTAYDQFTNPYIEIYGGDPGQSGWTDIKLYSVTQTVPKYHYIPPISDPDITSFGLDGPHRYDTVDAGIAMLESHGVRGTIWADVGIQKIYSSENITKLKGLLANGWELGIHYSKGLADMPWANATAVMDSEYDTISAIFGQAPTSWCSLENADNATLADYAYTHLGMVWRNGDNGVNGLTNVGNVDEDNWPWWEAAISAGMVYPSFTHELDLNPPIAFSLSPDDLARYIDSYAAKGIEVVPWHEYWTTAQNTYHTTISNFEVEDGRVINFTVSNIGGNSRLLIDVDWAKTIVDSKGNQVDFETTADGIIVEVGAGNYSIRASSASLAQSIEPGDDALSAEDMILQASTAINQLADVDGDVGIMAAVPGGRAAY